MIETRLLEHAIAVADHGSFAIAAQTLGMSQSALSRSIQSLESQLEVQLFNRGPKRIDLTDAGQVLLVHAREIVARNASLRHEMGLVQRNQSPSFTVAAGPYPAEAIIGTVFAKLVGLHPATQLRLRVESWNDAVKLLRAREVDLCVAEISLLGENPELQIEPLPPLQGYFVVRAGHPLLSATNRTGAEILSYPIVSTSRLPARVLSPLQQLREDVVPPPTNAFPAINCEQVSVMRQIVSQSDFVGMFVLPVIEASLRTGELVVLGEQFPWLSTQFGVIRSRNRPLSPVGESLVELLHEVATLTLEKDRLLAAEFLPADHHQ